MTLTLGFFQTEEKIILHKGPLPWVSSCPSHQSSYRSFIMPCQILFNDSEIPYITPYLIWCCWKNYGPNCFIELTFIASIQLCRSNLLIFNDQSESQNWRGRQRNYPINEWSEIILTWINDRDGGKYPDRDSKSSVENFNVSPHHFGKYYFEVH